MPVLAVTGTTEAGAVERLMRCGFDAILQKPFTRAELGRHLQRQAESLYMEAGRRHNASVASRCADARDEDEGA